MDTEEDPVSLALEVARAGALRHDGPGRTDDLKISVPAESFVIPADVISAVGEGNTEAGFKIFEKMFPPPREQRADGGKVPIVAAGGEFIVHPMHIKKLGGGDLKRGHRSLEDMVKVVRAKHVKKLKSLPRPHR